MRKVFFAGFLAAALFSVSADWTETIRSDHPRLYINREMILQVRQHARHYRALVEKMKREVDMLPSQPELKFRTGRFKLVDGRVKYKSPYIAGVQLVERNGAEEAVKAATLYQLTGKREYAVKGIAYLKMALNFFEWCHRHHTMLEWEAGQYVNAVVAYDWLCGEMTPEERKDFGSRWLKYVQAVQGRGDYMRPRGGYKDGNYGVNNHSWLTGLAMFRDGIDDVAAERLLRSGYENNLKMMEFRDLVSGGTGLLGAGTQSYSFGYYPYATFHFLHTWKSATGKDIAGRWRQMRDYPHWFDWMKIPKDGVLHTYGIGDMIHRTNHLETVLMYTHMAQCIHFYPETAGQAYRLIGILPEKQRRFHERFPFLPLILTGFNPELPRKTEEAAPSRNAAYFPSFGLAIMRSGERQSDTHALFRTGAQYGNHQHYDESHFVIFKHDFLALDSGSRTKTMHHCHYAPQSVAHNTILIHQAGEPAAPFWKPWGSDAEVSSEKCFSHGGQYRTVGAKNLAFADHRHYTYAANDATAVYRPDKCREAVRQFVYIRPDYFIVFDRVTPAKPEQRREYLLHTQNRPQEIAPGVFRADHGKGRLFQKTLFPVQPKIVAVGGSGRQFWASGRNWPLPQGEKAFEKPNYYGQWRLEISDGKPAAESRFLHLLQAADTGTPDMVASEQLETPGMIGVKFTDRSGRNWEVHFNRSGPVGGRIIGREGSRFLVNQTL